jgi:hypothetical protein
MKKRNKLSPPLLAYRAVKALQEAVTEAIAEHRRLINVRRMQNSIFA